MYTSTGNPGSLVSSTLSIITVTQRYRDIIMPSSVLYSGFRVVLVILDVARPVTEGLIWPFSVVHGIRSF